QWLPRHTWHEKQISADGATCSDYGCTAEHGRIWINRDVVLDLWMPLATFFDFAVLVLLKAARAEGDTVIKFHPRADFACLADYYARAVIDKKMRTNLCARMDIDPRAAVRPLGHDAGNQRQPI